MKTKIVICSDQEKRKQLSSNQTIEDKKYMTYQEFCKKYYFDYQEDAIYYLMKKYQIHLDVAKDILKNMRYLEKKN